MADAQKEQWKSKLGVILAVAGSAVGLGNFLRFPGLAAQYGGGSFMIAYFVSLLLLGLPIAWVEWSLGRKGGSLGFNTCPGIFWALTKSRGWLYAGLLGVLIPLGVYFFYINIEIWCLEYAWSSLTGALKFATPAEYQENFNRFCGLAADGTVFKDPESKFIWYFIAVNIVNFSLVYRGLSKGIEKFCSIAMPTLLVISLVILVRVLTLGTPDANNPQRNIEAGLGYMWNFSKTTLVENVAKPGESAKWEPREFIPQKDEFLKSAEQKVAAEPQRYKLEQSHPWSDLLNPQLWLAAAGQVFFSLTVGFGVVMTYASYLKREDDLALSSVTAAGANEFCEVGLGGMITVPASVTFLGLAGVVGGSVFSLGFIVLPQVFASMPGGQIFAALFFFLLFIAAITSTLSMLQPSVAFLEEAMGLRRSSSVVILGIISLVGSFLVAWFSSGLSMLDSLDFWMGTFGIYLLALLQVIMFGWVWGMKNGMNELKRGSAISVPRFFEPVIRYVCPLILLAIFISWIVNNFIGTPSSALVQLLAANPGSVLGVSLIVLLFIAGALVIKFCPRYKQLPQDPPQQED